MVPHDAKGKPGLKVADAGRWNGFQRPANLLPTDPRFAEIAQLYYDELTRLYGKADYYSMDPFHESSDDAAIDYARAGEAMMSAMKRINPNAVWVIQGWTENPRPQMVDGMKQGDLLVLDLFSECRPMFGAPSIWKRQDGYKQHEWLFCLLQNFGANVGLHGRMDQLINNFYDYKSLYDNRKGIGFTMEGSENNPVMFELMSELPWRPEKFKREDWVRDYVKARYGKAEPLTLTAWRLLSESIYNCPAGNNQQGPHESIFCGRPTTNNFQASSWSKMKNYYDIGTVREAARLMNDEATVEHELSEKYEHLRQDYSQEQQQLVSLDEARRNKPKLFE
jgi:alpha-N-acetylglucosaminidase